MILFATCSYFVQIIFTSFRQRVLPDIYNQAIISDPAADKHKDICTIFFPKYLPKILRYTNPWVSFNV